MSATVYQLSVDISCNCVSERREYDENYTGTGETPDFKRSRPYGDYLSIKNAFLSIPVRTNAPERDTVWQENIKKK